VQHPLKPSNLASKAAVFEEKIMSDKFETLKSNRWLRGKKVCERYDCGLSTLYRWVAQGAFPAPKKIGAGASRWSAADLNAYDDDPETWREQRGSAA